ncbi:cytidine and deoxycytidylate deaminase zinc-binding region family protein [Mycobacterium intracellulare]|nr:cytidine and deoxycytidylate deaminase zinc-binding region family protein [Mycobacterium intracellulare]
MTVSPGDGLDAAMRLAIEQSTLVKGTTYPNPPVGAVILDAGGEVVGVGGTEPAGGDHAEILALRRAGDLAAGGTVVVTLEPCNHYGKTPPCVNALLDAKVATVVYAVADPNPQAAGARRGSRRRASRCAPECWPTRSPAGRCASGCTSSGPGCRI